jgi:hypothetical protein
VTVEKIAFLLTGVGFLVLSRILYAKRQWFARITTEFMFFYKDSESRSGAAEDAEETFRVLLGYVVPVFMALWLLVVAVQ